jgi:protein phosphatase
VFPEILIASAVVVALVVGFFLFKGMKSPAPSANSNNGASKPSRSAPPSRNSKPAASALPAESKTPSIVPNRVSDAAAKSQAPSPAASLEPLIEPPDEEEQTGPTKLILVTAVGMTDPGLKRKHNEDAYVIVEKHNLFAIADGMGMHAAGEVASKLTIESISEAYEKNLFLDTSIDSGSKLSYRNRLTKIIERANNIVLTMANEVDAYQGMGTTVVMAHFSQSKQRAYIAHVGDSRCYRLRGNEIRQMTTDHTLGSIGITGKTSGILSRAVGIEENIEVDISVDEPQIGDIYLLCSDGLSRMTTDDKILSTVRASSDLDDAVRNLIVLANEGGGRDNVTTILIRVDPSAS